MTHPEYHEKFQAIRAAATSGIMAVEQAREAIKVLNRQFVTQSHVFTSPLDVEANDIWVGFELYDVGDV